MGFLKIDRQITDSAIWNDGTPFDKAHAWIDLLLYANWADKERMVRGKMITVKRGSMFVSDSFLANRWHWSRNRVRRYLAELQAAHMLVIKRSCDGTCITLVNYSKFQDVRTGSGTGDDTTDGTTGGTTDGTQSKNIKKYKNTRTRARASVGAKFNNSPQREYEWGTLEDELLATNGSM